MHQKQNKQAGFTIVELLIVIVVIAILAAITIVAYNGIQNRAKTSSAQSAANIADKKAEAYAVDGPTGKYPVAATDLTSAASTTTYVVTAGSVDFTTAPSATAAPNSIIFRKCGTGSPANQAAITTSNIVGVQFLYWNYTNGNANSFTTAGSDSSTSGVTCPTS